MGQRLRVESLAAGKRGLRQSTGVKRPHRRATLVQRRHAPPAPIPLRPVVDQFRYFRSHPGSLADPAARAYKAPDRTLTLEWQTVAFIDGRFTLTFVVPVVVDYSKRSVAQAGKPR